MTARRLPPIASDADRMAAAHIDADRLCAEMRETELARELWTEASAGWAHFIDSKAGITSERHGN